MTFSFMDHVTNHMDPMTSNMKRNTLLLSVVFVNDLKSHSAFPVSFLFVRFVIMGVMTKFAGSDHHFWRPFLTL